MQGEASILSSVSKSTARTFAAGLERSQADSSHFSTSADLYEKFFFSFIAEANRSIKVHTIVRLFEYFFISIQILLSAYNDFIPYEDTDNRYITFLKIFYFGFIGPADNMIPFMIAVSIIDIITELFFLLCIIDFQINHEYRKWMLYVLRLWHGHLFGILVIPNFLMITKGFAYLGLHNNPLGYVIVIITSLCGCISIWHNIIILPFLSRTPYLSPSSIHAWNIKKIYQFLLLAAIPMGLESFLNDEFEDWFEMVPLLLMIGIFVYLIYELCFLPFKGVFFNALLFGCFNGVILGSIFSIIETVSEGVSDIIFYSCPIILAVIMTIVTYFIIRNYRKKVEHSLNYISYNEQGVRPTEEMKKEHLIKLNITKKRKAVMFIQIGFEGMCDMFVDWSLCKYLFDIFPADDDIVSFISWLVALFPSEIQFLHKLVTHGTKIVGISIDNRFMFFQIHRIHIFRQSSTSRETSKDFNKVKSITDQTISAFCKFWVNLSKPNFEFKNTIYQGLSKIKQQAEASWSEALDKYPNNARFAQEHAIFLLEVGCQFKESIKQNQIAHQLENGVRTHNDKTFHHFVLSYPSYLKKGIVDVKGNLKGPQIEKKNLDPNATSNSLMSSNRLDSSKNSSSINSENSEDSSTDQIDLQEGERFLPQMYLRLALQRAVKGLKAKTIKKIMISALLRAVLTIAFIILCILLTKPLLRSHKDNFEIIYKIDKVQHSLSLMSVQIPWLLHEAVFDGNPDYSQFKQEVGSLWVASNDDENDDTPNYRKVLNQFESQIDFDKTKRQIICDLALKTLNGMNDLNNKYYKTNYESNDLLKPLKTLYYEVQFPTYSCAKGPEYPNITPFIVEDIISMDYLIRTLVLQIRDMTLEDNDIAKYWGVNSSDFCEMMLNQNYISSLINLLSFLLSDPLSNIFSDDLKNIFITDESELLLQAKNKRKEKIYQNTFRSGSLKYMHNNSTNKLRDFINSQSFDSMIEKEVKKDYQLQQKLKKIKDKYMVSTKYIELLDQTPIEDYPPEYIKDHKFLLNNSDNNQGKGNQTVVEEPKTKTVVVKTDKLDEVCEFIIAFSPFILSVFILPSIIFLADGLDIEMNALSNVLRNVPKVDCLKAGERIKPVDYTENQSKNKKKMEKKKQSQLIADASNTHQYPFWLFDIVSALVIIIFFIVFAVICKSAKNKIEQCTQYYALFMAERNILYKINKDISYSLLFIECENSKIDTKLGQTTYTNATVLFASALNEKVNFHQITEIINSGDKDTNLKSSILADSVINQIRFDPLCPDEMTSEIVIDYYRCTSLERTISYFIELIEACVADFESTHNYLKLSHSVAPYLTHMLDTRIGVGFTEIAERFKEIFDSEVALFNAIIIVIPVISVIFTIITYLFEMLLLISVSNQIEVFKSLMLRINPISFVINNHLVSLVYGKNIKSSQIVSASHAVFTTSPDAMISLNNEGIIEYLNPATTSIFGFTPEQMLGQHVKMILNSESKEASQLFYTMQLMQSGQSSLIYECEMKGIRDDGVDIYLKVTLIGFTSSNEKTAETFALMCRDMTNEITQKNAVEEAKKQSEHLLLQILPKDIIMRLNRGDTDISFTVQSSTIAFIDIEKFSNYSASLSASEIMQNLGLVFTAYDKLLAKYSLIIKIKLIGDDYMLAAGLFNQDVEPSMHASQVVNFTLECLDAIEDLNELLNASLQVRIGVNSGGPLIAGVLGTDKPLFDIIGDPINVASRLQSTDIPGFVQISQQTYNYVANVNEFHIEQRGEVELKGKGKQMTYLVHPRQRNVKEEGDNSQASMELTPSDNFQIEAPK